MKSLASPLARVLASAAAFVACSAVTAPFTATDATARPVSRWIDITQDDFTHGTLIINKPGRYRLVEDISFNPNSPATLNAAIAGGSLPADTAEQLGLAVPVDAFSAGNPLPTQFARGHATQRFVPGGPFDANYDPAAYGIGFFAAIAITANNVVLDLNGHTLEQSAEHALLQRFFSVIELASAPFIPKQGPHDFGSQYKAARNVYIRNGIIGRSAHHGIHGNGNRNITVHDVVFDGYEVGAVALNGVRNLRVRNVVARNRKDVPVVGTYSSARFITPYVELLARRRSTTTLEVNGASLSVDDVLADLRDAVNNAHHDLVVDPNIVDGRPQIDPLAHPDEYALFANLPGVIDGNAYSFLVHPLGVAVNGFKTRAATKPARNIYFHNVRVLSQHAFINEVVTLSPTASKPVVDPVGAVFQVFNAHPVSGQPVTTTSLDPSLAEYVGNPVANAQALVAKAHLGGEFDGAPLDVSRMSIDADVLRWVEAVPGYERLSAIVPTEAHRLCNGDSMFHVNKGVIGFRIDGARNVLLRDTEVNDIRNLGAPGSDLCGDYSNGRSHPQATLPGYGGAWTRAYSIAGSNGVTMFNARADGVLADAGSASGVSVITDSRRIQIGRSQADDVVAGAGQPGSPVGPDDARLATGFRVGPDVRRSVIWRSCADALDGFDGEAVLVDESGHLTAWRMCR